MQQPGVNAAAIADKERDKDSSNHDAHGASGHRNRADPSGGMGKLGETPRFRCLPLLHMLSYCQV